MKSKCKIQFGFWKVYFLSSVAPRKLPSFPVRFGKSNNYAGFPNIVLFVWSSFLFSLCLLSFCTCCQNQELWRVSHSLFRQAPQVSLGTKTHPFTHLLFLLCCRCNTVTHTVSDQIVERLYRIALEHQQISLAVMIWYNFHLGCVWFSDPLSEEHEVFCILRGVFYSLIGMKSSTCLDEGGLG